MRSWRDGGLLELMSERVLIASDPLDEERALGRLYGFAVVEPRELQASRQVKPNVITIGQALAHGLRMMRSDHVLFLENDFALHPAAAQRPQLLVEELAGAVAMLLSGALVVYLRSRTEQGCDSALSAVSLTESLTCLHYSTPLWPRRSLFFSG